MLSRKILERRFKFRNATKGRIECMYMLAWNVKRRKNDTKNNAKQCKSTIFH